MALGMNKAPIEQKALYEFQYCKCRFHTTTLKQSPPTQKYCFRPATCDALSSNLIIQTFKTYISILHTLGTIHLRTFGVHHMEHPIKSSNTRNYTSNAIKQSYGHSSSMRSMGTSLTIRITNMIIPFFQYWIHIDTIDKI